MSYKSQHQYLMVYSKLQHWVVIYLTKNSWRARKHHNVLNILQFKSQLLLIVNKSQEKELQLATISKNYSTRGLKLYHLLKCYTVHHLQNWTPKLQGENKKAIL